MLHRDERVIVIRDINPQAPTHLLVLPTTHLASIREIEAGNASVAGHMTVVANDMARREGVFEKGYRLVVNCGDEGGQTVGHLAFARSRGAAVVGAAGVGQGVRPRLHYSRRSGGTLGGLSRGLLRAMS